MTTPHIPRVSAPQTPLGRKLDNGHPLAKSLSRLAAVVAGGHGEDVDLPGLGPAFIELIGAREMTTIEAAVVRDMAELGLEQTTLTITQYELARATRTLAIAVRDRDDHSQPFGTLDEWGGLDPDRVGACWSVYGDVRERLDPLAHPLTEEEAMVIDRALKKKDATLLRSFGVAKLCAWLVTTGAPPSTSPQASSGSSDSPSEH